MKLHYADYDVTEKSFNNGSLHNGFSPEVRSYYSHSNEDKL